MIPLKIINFNHMKNWERDIKSGVFSSRISKKQFNLILLPDTQTYSKEFPDIFLSQTKWIAANAKDIAFVLHQGDITELNTEKEWQVAAKAMRVMDGKVPYTFVPGNHDMGSSPDVTLCDKRITNLFN